MAIISTEYRITTILECRFFCLWETHIAARVPVGCLSHFFPDMMSFCCINNGNIATVSILPSSESQRLLNMITIVMGVRLLAYDKEHKSVYLCKLCFRNCQLPPKN